MGDTETTILIATDADEVFDDVDAALAGGHTTLTRVRTGREVRGAVKEQEPDLVLLDLQIGNMGGVATCLDIRLEESAARLGPQRVLLLLDRADDAFIAGQSGADAWLVKPLDALSLRRSAEALLAAEPI